MGAVIYERKVNANIAIGKPTHVYLLIKLFDLFTFTVAFKMYDLDGDDKISREELLAVLHMMVGANISEEQVCTPYNM